MLNDGVAKLSPFTHEARRLSRSGVASCRRHRRELEVQKRSEKTLSQHRISSSSIRSSYLKSNLCRISSDAAKIESYSTSDWAKAMTSRHK